MAAFGVRINLGSKGEKKDALPVLRRNLPRMTMVEQNILVPVSDLEKPISKSVYDLTFRADDTGCTEQYLVLKY